MIARIVAALWLATGMDAASADQTGAVAVVDGENLEMQGQRIRLFGIDALEPGQICLDENRPWPCGDEAARALSALIGTQPVRCQPIRNASGYVLATCDLNGEDLGGWMVAAGWALADASQGNEYAPLEDTARDARAGVWIGESVTPAAWREGKRLKLPRTPQAEEQDRGLPDQGPLNMPPLNAVRRRG